MATTSQRYGEPPPSSQLGAAAGGLFITVALHVAALALVIGMRGARSTTPTFEPHNVVEVEVVRFGKPRPTDWLPRKVPTKSAAPVETAATKLTRTETAPVVPPPTQQTPLPHAPTSTSNRAELFRRMQEETDKQTETEGSLSGQVGGTNTLGKGHPYYQALKAKVNQRWTIAFLTEEELASLSATGCLRIAEDGTIVSRERTTSSGNARFDESLEEALARLDQQGKLDPVPPELRSELAQGVCFRFRK